MRTRLARFLLILTALWLPLQAVAGMTMKLCAHGNAAPQAAQAAQAAMAGDHCPYHDADGAAPAGRDRAPNTTACDDCGICHLASVGYMPVAEVRTGVVPTDRYFPRWPAASLASHIPEPPQHPPKRSA